MSAVSEWIVREYFEGLGFLVNQPRKHAAVGRHKIAEEEIDLVVCRPRAGAQRLPDALVWGRDELAGVARAIVAVRGWHTERFSASTFEQAPDILRFAEPDAVAYGRELLGDEMPAKILCLPRLPVSDELREQVLELLRAKGVDGVLTFETMLVDVIGRVDANRNYERSDLLQIIRILKSYELLKDSQLDLFEKRRKQR